MTLRRSLVALPLLAALACAATGCGTFARSYDPAGVDELTVPTPTPRAHDFVGSVDNPWLPLRDGASWSYAVARPGAPAAVRTVEVLPGRVDVDGVATTAVRSTLDGAVTTDYYAQDTRGNVWWFGRVAPGGDPSTWRAGERGAHAGLAMAAEPRAGDGYRTAYAPGVQEDVATVAEVDARTVQVDVTSSLAPGDVTRERYERGTGLVERLDAVTGEDDELQR